MVPVVPCLAINIKRGTLALSQKINKNIIFEGLMEDKLPL